MPLALHGTRLIGCGAKFEFELEGWKYLNQMIFSGLKISPFDSPFGSLRAFSL